VDWLNLLGRGYILIQPTNLSMLSEEQKELMTSSIHGSGHSA
jgi:hypothetical protein